MKGCYIIVLVVERYENKTQGYALLAQLVEQRTLNPSVQGSNPCVPTTPPNDPADRWSAGFFSFLSSLPAVIPQASAHFPALSLPLRRTTGKLSEPSPLRFIRT